MHTEDGRHLMTEFLCAEDNDPVRKGVDVTPLGAVEAGPVDEHDRISVGRAYGLPYAGQEAVPHPVQRSSGKPLRKDRGDGVEEILLRYASLPEQRSPPATL